MADGNSALTPFFKRLYGMVFLRAAFAVVLASAAGYGILKLENPSITSAAGYDLKTHPQGAQPYTLDAAAKRGTLVVGIEYHAGQNTHFTVEPQGACVTHVMAGPLPQGVAPPAPLALDVEPFCKSASVDFAAQLKEGRNRIVLETIPYAGYVDHPEWMLIYIAPQLLGAHTVSTLGCLLVFAGFAYALWVIARVVGMNGPTCGLLLAGFALYTGVLVALPNLSYSNNLPGHISYIRYMAENGMHPYGYDGWENNQPPLYYLLAGHVFHWTDMPGIIAPLTAVRLLSLFLYMVFVFYGLRTLCVAIQPKNAAFYAGCLLVVFWPVAPIVATTITNDIAVYAAWAVAFYYIAAGFEKRRLSAFQLAVAFTGLAFAFKTSALALVCVTACCGIYALYAKRVTWRDMLRGRSLLALAAFLLGALGNVGKFIQPFFAGKSIYGYLSTGANEIHPASYFVNFNPYDYVVHPTVTYANEPGYLNYFLKTMLYSEHGVGSHTLLPEALNVLLLILLLGIVAGGAAGVVRTRGKAESLVPYMLGMLIPFAGPLIFMLLRHYMFCQNFRYVLPLVVPMAVLYARLLQAMGANARLRTVYWLGILLAAGLTGGAIDLWITLL